MEKCYTCEGSGYLFKIKEYNLSSGVTVKRKRIKICTECNGIGLIPTKTSKDNLEHIKVH